MGKIVRCSALIVFGFLAGLFAVEVVLQLGALVNRATGRRLQTGWASPNLRVLTLGDSNTFGVYVEESEAYPRMLEHLWNEEPGARPIEVVNLGAPGTNSSNIRRALPELLRAYHPDVVTVMVGINDFWTAPEPVASDDSLAVSIDGFLWRHSRLFRLAFMIRRALQREGVETAGAATPCEESIDEQARARYAEIGYVPDTTRSVPPGLVPWCSKIGPTPGWLDARRENLRAIAKTVQEGGAKFVFLTYPADRPLDRLYGQANDDLREAARAIHTPLVDLGSVITPRCSASLKMSPQGPGNADTKALLEMRPHLCDVLYWDRHPTKEGHRVAAELIREGLAQQFLSQPETER